MDFIKQILKEMGLTDEQISKFIKEAINDKFIPKHRFDEVNAKNKQLTDDFLIETNKSKNFLNLKAIMLL